VRNSKKGTYPARKEFTITSSRTGFHYAWIILIIGMLVTFSSVGLARFGYTTVLPSMQASLGMDNTQAGAIATATMVGYLLLAALGGALAARYGSRIVITAGLVLAGGSMLLTGLADGFFAAAVWRALTGVGSGASNIPVMALMSAWFAHKRRGLAAGIVVTGSAAGLILVGPLVPRVLSSYGADGWRVCWLIFGVVTLAVAVMTAIFLRNRPSDKGLQPLGTVPETSKPTQGNGALQWRNVYRSAIVWHLGLVYIAFGFAYIIYVTFFVKYLITEGGYTSTGAGSLFMVVGWASLFCGLIWGAVSDIIGRKLALVFIYLMHAVSFSLFALWPEPAGFVLSAILFGLSAWSMPVVMAAACGDLLGPRLSAAGLGFVSLFFGIGQAVGPTVAGAIADATGSLVPAMLLAGGVSLLGAFGAMMLRPIRGTKNGMGPQKVPAAPRCKDGESHS